MMTTEETNKFFLDALNFAIHQLTTDGSLPATAVVKHPDGSCAGCNVQFSDAKSKAAAIAAFVSELKHIKPQCAIIIVPVSISAGRGRKRKTSLCVAFQSHQNKFVSMVNYEKSKTGEFTFEAPYFCDDNEIVLSGHEYFGDVFQ